MHVANLGLSAQEFWASVIMLCPVGPFYIVPDVVRSEILDSEKAWQWGDAYRRPKTPPIWGTHKNCAAAMAIMLCAAASTVSY